MAAGTAALLLAACWIRESTDEQLSAVLEEMSDHDEQAIVARDAVIRGDPVGAAAAGAAMGERLPLPELPDTLRPLEVELQATAAQLSVADGLPAAAAGVGAIVTTCGRCHSAAGIDPSLIRPALQEDHGGAMESVWWGLLVGTDDGFQVAAAALATPAGQPPGGNAAFVKATTRLMTAPAAERGAAYGALLRTCTECHAR